MGERITLPSGGWVELRDYRELRAGDKKRILRGIKDGQSQVGSALDVTDGIIAMLVTNWEIPGMEALPVPSASLESIELLTIADYDALVAAVGPAAQALMPKAPSPDQADDPKSPTPPAAG